MSFDLGPAVVILLYLGSLAVILAISPRWNVPRDPTAAPTPFWRSSRFWASVAAIVQIAVYALFG